MIDWDLPIRLVKSKRQVFARRYISGIVWLDTDPSGSGAIPYHANGEPISETPWGNVENYSLLDEVFGEEEPGDGLTEETRLARVQAFNDQVEEQMGDNPLWGAF